MPPIFFNANPIRDPDDMIAQLGCRRCFPTTDNDAEYSVSDSDQQ